MNNILLNIEAAELQTKGTIHVINELRETVTNLVNNELVLTDEEMIHFEEETELLQNIAKKVDEDLKPPRPSLESISNNLPPPQKIEPEDMLPKVLICGIGNEFTPKVIICELNNEPSCSKKLKIIEPSEEKKQVSQSNVQLHIASKSETTQGKTDQSKGAHFRQNDVIQSCSRIQYIPEKCTQTNAPLNTAPNITKQVENLPKEQTPKVVDPIIEDATINYPLVQEGLVDDDARREALEEQIAFLEAEMQLLSLENSELNDKIAKAETEAQSFAASIPLFIAEETIKRTSPSVKSTNSKDEKDSAEDVPSTSSKENETPSCNVNKKSSGSHIVVTSALEKQLEAMEATVAYMQDKLLNAQRERKELAYQSNAVVEATRHIHCRALHCTPSKPFYRPRSAFG